MRILICDICQSPMQDKEKPFAFGVGTDHLAYAKPKAPGTEWSTGEPAEAKNANPFMIQPFKFVRHWEMCAACGVQLMQTLERAAAGSRKEIDEFKKLMS